MAHVDAQLECVGWKEEMCGFVEWVRKRNSHGKLCIKTPFLLASAVSLLVSSMTIRNWSERELNCVVAKYQEPLAAVSWGGWV